MLRVYRSERLYCIVLSLISRPAGPPTSDALGKDLRPLLIVNTKLNTGLLSLLNTSTDNLTETSNNNK